jgi:hypothetical protein
MVGEGRCTWAASPEEGTIRPEKNHIVVTWELIVAGGVGVTEDLTQRRQGAKRRSKEERVKVVPHGFFFPFASWLCALASLREILRIDIFGAGFA